MGEDAFDLAAASAMATAHGSCLNDGNTRTSFRAMQIWLAARDIHPDFDTEDFGRKIIALAEWLRDKA